MDKTIAARTKSKAQMNRAKNTLPPPRPRLVKSEQNNDRAIPHPSTAATTSAFVDKKNAEPARDLKERFAHLQKYITNLSRNRQLVVEDLRDGWEAILKEIRSTYKKVSTHM